MSDSPGADRDRSFPGGARQPRAATGRRRRAAVATGAAVLALLVGAVGGLALTGRGPFDRTAQPVDDASGQPGQPGSAGPSTTGSTSPTPSGVGRFSAAPSPSSSTRPSNSPSASGSPDAPAGAGVAGGPWPDGSNTGVPAGTTLKASGSIKVTKKGTVISGKDVSGCIEVRADNVTIRNTRVRGSCASGTIAAKTSSNPNNLIIENVEVDGLKKSSSYPLVAYTGFTCRRCNLHGGGHGVQLGHSVVVQDSWIHDASTSDGSHNNAIAGFSSYDLTFRHNRLECLDLTHCTGALSLLDDGGGPTHNALVEGNLFSGGGYCVYAGVFDTRQTGIRFIGNAFSTTPYPKCGDYGPVTAFKPTNDNQWIGNYWNDAERTVIPTPNN